MKTICVMRDVFRALADFENSFEEVHGLSLNEAMILCALHESPAEMTSTALSKETRLKPSNTSKILRSLEERRLIIRSLGEEDRRQMYFRLTPQGEEQVEKLKTKQIEIPEIVKSLFR